jgi:iron uptake system component EfeO
MVRRKYADIATVVTALCLLSACSAGTSATHDGSTVGAQGIAITISENQCAAGWRHASAGLQTFQIRNISAGVLDVSLTNAQSGGVYAEIEALGPGTSRSMQADMGSGSYAFQCDTSTGAPLTGPTVVIPGNVQGGSAVIPADVTDTLSAVSSDRAYVQSGLATAARQASVLAADIEAGDLLGARAAWLTAHLSWERLGSAYGMFSEYDDEIDGTPSGLAGGVSDPAFTGFYRIEYGLWHGQSAAKLTGPAQRLVHDVGQLKSAYPGMARYPQAALGDLALRTHEILEHMIRFQLSGADDFGSGSTLATADANIEATRAQLKMLQPILRSQYSALPSVYSSLDRLQRLIEDERTADGWTPVSALSVTSREQINAAAAETVQLLAPIAAMLEASPLP